MADPIKTTTPVLAPTMTMEEILKLVTAASAATVSAMQAAQNKAPPAQVAKPKCIECGQVLTGCGGKHVQMVVYPQRYPQHADYFPGVVINGIRYLSNGDGHRVTVPAEAESTISGIVSNFEQNEQELATGRKAERHSGHVGPGGTSVQPANQAWR